MANNEFIQRGQLSTVILLTLLKKDKYGYEIIDEILKSTNGKMSIKQPSLYSSLKRMEEQSLISSYWRDSDIGGKRHYYHLTDLGKKHLEKWKNDLNPSLFEKESNSDLEEKKNNVLQQENLFSLNKLTAKEEPKTENVSTDKNDTFVQFDLFSNSTIINPPSTKIEETISQNPEPTKQNPIITNYEPKTENIVSHKPFEYIKKTNKSFTDNFKNIKNYEKKYNEKEEPLVKAETFENTKINSENIKTETTINQLAGYVGANKLINNTFNIFEENNNTLNNNNSVTNNFINNPTMESNYKEVITEQNINPVQVQTQNLITNDNGLKELEKIEEVKKDDGIFITERISEENMPKAFKWSAPRYELINDSFTSNFKFKQEKNEDKIKDLYENSKNIKEENDFENNVAENFDDYKTNPKTYNDLISLYELQNIKFKPYVKNIKKTQKDFNMVRVTKLNMITTLSIFLYVLLVSTISLTLCTTKYDFALKYPLLYIITASAFLMIFLTNLFIYIKLKHKRIALDLNLFKFNWTMAILSFAIIPLTFAVNILFGLTTKNIMHYGLAIAFPCSFSLIYFVYYFTRKIILKSKKIY